MKQIITLKEQIMKRACKIVTPMVIIFRRPADADSILYL